MLERLTKQLENHQPKSNTVYIHWALVLVLAMTFTGWMVYQGVTQQVEAQSIPQSIRINYPTSGDLLLSNGIYNGEYEVLTDTTSSGVEFLVKNPSGVSISIYTSTSSPKKGIYPFVWDLTKLLDDVNFLISGGSTNVTLIVQDGGRQVYSQPLRIWRSRNVFGTDGPAGITDWQKPTSIPQQEFGSDQLALDLVWRGRNFAPPNSEWRFYNKAHVLIGHFVNESSSLRKIDEWTVNFGSAFPQGLSFLWSHIGPEFWNYTGGANEPDGPTLGMQIISYDDGRGTPAINAIDEAYMTLSSFVTWSAPVSNAGPVYPGASYELKWTVNTKANPPSGLKADITAYYNYDSVSKTWKSQVVVSDIDPSVSRAGWAIPGDVKLGSKIKFLITTKLSTPQGSVEYSHTNSSDLLVSSDVAPIELTSPTQIGTGPDNGVIKPKLVTINNKEHRSFTLTWKTVSSLPAGFDRVAYIHYELTDGTFSADVGAVGLSDGSYTWIDPLEQLGGVGGEAGSAYFIGKEANLVFRSPSNSFIYTSYPITFGGRLTTVQPQSNEVVAGQPYKIKWTYPTAYASQQSVFHQNTQSLQIHYKNLSDANSPFVEIKTLAPSEMQNEGAPSWTAYYEWPVIPPNLAGKHVQISFTWIYKLSVGSAYAKSSFPAVDFDVIASSPSIIFTEPLGNRVYPTGTSMRIAWTVDPKNWVLTGALMNVRYESITNPDHHGVITVSSPTDYRVPYVANKTDYSAQWTVPANLASEKVKVIVKLENINIPNDNSFPSDQFSVISAGYTGDADNPADYQIHYVSVKKDLFGFGETNSKLTDIISVSAADTNFSETAIIKYGLRLYGMVGGVEKLISAFPLQRSGTGALSISGPDRDSQLGAGVLNTATKIQLVIGFDITGPVNVDQLPSVTSVTILYSTDFTTTPFTITVTPSSTPLNHTDAGLDAYAQYVVRVDSLPGSSFTGPVDIDLSINSMTNNAGNPAYPDLMVHATFVNPTLTLSDTVLTDDTFLQLGSTEADTYTFTVKASSAKTSGGTWDAISTPANTLIVGSVTPPDGTVPQVNIAFTAPVQVGNGEKNPDLQFTLSLYEALTLAYRSTPLTTDSRNQGSVSIPSADSPLELSKTYSAYIKTPQHLSQKANQSVTVTQPTAGNTLSVQLTFPELSAGDVLWGNANEDPTYSSWDQVDANDFSQYLAELGQSLLYAFTNFNNDKDLTTGKDIVDTLDSFPFIGNPNAWFVIGALRADGILQPPPALGAL